MIPRALLHVCDLPITPVRSFYIAVIIMCVDECSLHMFMSPLWCWVAWNGKTVKIVFRARLVTLITMAAHEVNVLIGMHGMNGMDSSYFY